MTRGEPPLRARMRRAGQAGPTRREQRALEPAPVARAKPESPRATARVGAKRRRRSRDQAARRAGQAGSEGRHKTRRWHGPSPGRLARRPASTPSADAGAESEPPDEPAKLARRAGVRRAGGTGRARVTSRDGPRRRQAPTPELSLETSQRATSALAVGPLLRYAPPSGPRGLRVRSVPDREPSSAGRVRSQAPRPGTRAPSGPLPGSIPTLRGAPPKSGAALEGPQRPRVPKARV